MIRFFIAICLILWSVGNLYAKNLHIVTTIKPIQSLIQNITAPNDTVVALIDANNSPHHFALKPSHSVALRKSDLVVMINPDFETFMQRSITIIPPKTKILKLSDAPRLTLHRTQRYGLSENISYAKDYHIWLSTDNALGIIEYITKELSRINPEKKTIYQRNLQTTKTKLYRLKADLKQKLMPIKADPFMVFHNGYQYFIKEYGLNLVGIITDNPAAYSSINRIQKAQKQLHDNKVKCVFKEPQFSNKAIETVIANTDTKIGMLDPLGGNISANKNLYFDLMRHLSNNLLSCLKQSPAKNKHHKNIH